MTLGTKIELVGSHDNPLGGFRLWRRGDKFFAVTMCDKKALSKEDPWGDLEKWKSELPKDKDLENVKWRTAQELYPFHYRFCEENHSDWNVCYILENYL